MDSGGTGLFPNNTLGGVDSGGTVRFPFAPRGAQNEPCGYVK